jgi:hypothetical protein
MNEGIDSTKDSIDLEKENIIMELGVIWTSLGQMGNNEHEVQDVMKLQQNVRDGIKDPTEALSEARIILEHKQGDH